MSHTPHHGSDMKAAFTGLIVGALALVIMCFAIVKLTNNMYAGEKSAAESTH